CSTRWLSSSEVTRPATKCSWSSATARRRSSSLARKWAGRVKRLGGSGRGVCSLGVDIRATPSPRRSASVRRAWRTGRARCAPENRTTPGPTGQQTSYQQTSQEHCFELVCWPAPTRLLPTRLLTTHPLLGVGARGALDKPAAEAGIEPGGAILVHDLGAHRQDRSAGRCRQRLPQQPTLQLLGCWVLGHRRFEQVALDAEPDRVRGRVALAPLPPAF